MQSITGTPEFGQETVHRPTLTRLRLATHSVPQWQSQRNVRQSTASSEATPIE